MSPNPIQRVLSTFRRHRVRALLMGGQACIAYGAAEFTRDSDFLVDVADANLRRLRAALAELKAEPVYVPALSGEVLKRGHACHFRCAAAQLADWRIDVMGHFRGGPAFAQLWQRRQTLCARDRTVVPLLGLEDLVAAKKTQRRKDWPMLARLIEADYLRAKRRPPRRKIEFWLLEARTPELLERLVRRFPGTASRLSAVRPALVATRGGDRRRAERELWREEERERAADRAYWTPLRAELERWRHARRQSRQT